VSTRTRELTREQYLAAIAKPKQRFQVLALGESGTVRLRERVPVPCCWFERDDLVEDSGKYLVQPHQAVITLFVDGVPSVLLYLAGPRIDACTFSYQLTPAQLGKAVAAMRRTKLARLIPRAAAHALENMPEARRGILQSELRALADGRAQRKAGRRSRP
jgi:hypothetical protein